MPAGASNVIVSSRLLAEVGPFDGGLRRTADWDMWLRLARHGPPAWVRSPLVANCIHGTNMFKDMTILFQELDVLARRHQIPVDRARHYRWAAWHALVDGQRWKALRYYGGAIRQGDLRSIGRARLPCSDRLEQTVRERRCATNGPQTLAAGSMISDNRSAVRTDESARDCSEQPVPYNDRVAGLHERLHVYADRRLLAVDLADHLNTSRRGTLGHASC